MPTQKINNPEQINDLGNSTGTLDGRYLKLDASNDPLTGRLDIIPSIPGTKGLDIQTLNDTPSFTVTQRGTGSVAVGASVFNLLRAPSGDSVADFSEPIMFLSQNRNSSGTMTGGILRYDSDGTPRAEINPNIQGTGTLAYLDGDFTLSPNGLLLLLKNHGVSEFYVNASGTAHSNGTPLIKEAPSNNGLYARKNAGWELVTNPNNISVLSSSIHITGSDGVYQEITGISLNLPSSGTYSIVGTIRAAIQSTSAGFIVSKLRNATDNADIANTETLIVIETALNTNAQNSVSMTSLVSVDDAKTIKLYAFRSSGAVYTFSDISSDAFGRTRLMYIKLS